MDQSMFDIADVHSEIGDGESLGSKAADFVTKGVPVALASGVVSILNTGISLGNMFGDFEKISTEDQIRSYDDNLADYYVEHKEGADLGGFLVTSLAPGALGVRGLKALQSIKGGGAIGEATASITGYAKSVEAAAIKRAAETVVGPENLIFGTLNTNKLKAIVAGAGDQALQGLAFETGVLLTMNQNPVINPDDRSYFASIWHNVPASALNAAVFGVVGGAFHAAKVTGDIKRLVQNEDRANWGAVSAEIMGDNSLLAGTRLSYANNQLLDYKNQYKELLQDVAPDDKFAALFLKKVERFEVQRDKFITEHFVNKDGELAEQLRGALKELKATTENGYLITEAEKAARVLGDAKNAKRVGDIDQFENMIPEFTQYHGSPDVVKGGFKRDERGSVYNLIGSGVYTTDSFQIASQYANRPGAAKPTIYGFKEKPGANVPIYDLDQAITPEMRAVLNQVDPEFAAFGEINKAGTLLDFYTTAARKSFGTGELPASVTSDKFQAIRDYLEGLGFRGLTHQGGILGGAKHKVKIYWYPENDLIKNNSPISAAAASRADAYMTHVIPNQNQRMVKLTGDQPGNIVDKAFPVAGDIDKVEWIADKQKMKIGGSWRNVSLEYKPLEDSPTESSLKFLQGKLSNKLPEGDVIPVDNIPLLEKAVRENMQGKVTLEGYTGPRDPMLELEQILIDQKNDLIQSMLNAGKGEDWISRATNTPIEWLQNRTGKISLSDVEDHTKPLYAKMTYSSRGEMDKFQAEGMTRVYEKAKLAFEQNSKAAAYALGEDIALFAKPSPLNNVTTISEVANFISAHNAPYGSTAAKLMQDGKMQNQITQKWGAARTDALHGPQESIVVDPRLLQEMNVVGAKLRSGDSDWVKLSEDLYPGAREEFILIQRKVMDAALKTKDPIEALAMITNSVAKDSSKIIRLAQDNPIVEYLETHQRIASGYADKQNVLNAAKGSTRRIPTDAYYAPPIDTSRQPYFVMVRTHQPLASENPFTFIVAPNAPALEKKLAAIKQQYGDTLEIYSSQNIKDKKIIDGVYDSGDFFTKSSIDASLQSKGLLTDFIPRTDDYIFREFDNWMWRQEHALARQSIEAIRADEFAQLRFLADGYGELYASKFGGKELNPADNPYLQLINTALNVSNKGHYDATWGALNRGTSRAWNAVGEIWGKMRGAAERGEVSIEDANRIAEQHGWRPPYGDVLREVWNPIIPDPNALSKFVGKANLAVATLMLRMDALNAVVNTISLPILMQAELTSIKKNLADPTIVGKLSNLLSEQVPGTSHRIPSAASLLYEGAGKYIANAKVTVDGVEQGMHEYFTKIGAIKTDPQLIRAAMDAVPLTQDAIKSQKGIVDYVSNLSARVGELGAKYTGNNLAEDFVRFQAAHAMFRVASEAGITNGAELASYINTYVNRVHGNYLSSQRPSLFQGPIGQAIGLFQTYQFNMIQQMTRYLQQGDRSAVVVAAALQNTIFGMQGNPLFYQLNSYIGNSNRENRDIVSTVGSIAGSPSQEKFLGLWDKDPARWLLYGLGANALQVNLYSRGDLTPRYATVVPDRIQDIPLVSIPTKAIGSFLDSMNMIAKGSGVAPSILHGLAHSGFNRPMAGLAALASGGRTTSQGTLLNAYNDIDGWLLAATLAGGRTLNEAVLVDQYHRMQSYQSAESRRVAEVSEAVKLTIAGQRGILNPEQTQGFLAKYVEAGGSLNQANRWLMKISNDSTKSVINRMKENYNSPFGKRMRDMMGGTELENLNMKQEE